MDISFENKIINAYKEICRQTKRIQVGAESVVPDTDEDIGKIATVQTAVLLKSKDLTGRGVLVSGEATAAIIYVTEDQQGVSFVRLSNSFSMEFEAADIDKETVAQINLNVINAEARVINPRKVSVSIELSGELSCYKLESLNIETALPAAQCETIHARYDSSELIFANAACEKTFAINEQFVFPGGKPCPSRLISQNVDLAVGDAQLIGSKVIVKGSADIELCYLSQEVCYPVKISFSTPFSQIIDIGEESMDNCTVIPQMTSCYFDLMDTINGEKALDAEIHGVLQLVCRCRRRMVYVADVYSNLMPAQCSMQSCQFNMVSDTQKLKLSADERINVVDDCSDVLSAFVSLAHLTQEHTKLNASVNIDVVYRSNSGILSAVRRSVSMEGECGSPNIRITGSRLTDVYLRPDSQFIDGHLSLELTYLVCSNIELSRVGAVSLDDQSPYDMSRYPTVTMVRAEGETLWELAKLYHSSIETISAVNDLSGDARGKMLLIPKCV